ncbi:unnamed protein product [Urochloa humidicola]
MEEEIGKHHHQHHFVLVHGVCHGAWSWYKVASLLSSAGHRVTALDMAACGARPERAEEVPSFEEYSRPLLDAVAALPPGEKAVLVGHSFGGQSLALAMESSWLAYNSEALEQQQKKVCVTNSGATVLSFPSKRMFVQNFMVLMVTAAACYLSTAIRTLQVFRRRQILHMLNLAMLQCGGSISVSPRLILAVYLAVLGVRR